MKRLLLSATALLATSGAMLADVVCTGIVVNEQNEPIIGAVINSPGYGSVVTDLDGRFALSVPDNAKTLEISYVGYLPSRVFVSEELGAIRLSKDDDLLADDYIDSEDYLYDESQIADDDDISQGVGTIQGSTDDIYFQTANYDFSVARFRFRGYNNDLSANYINGVYYNDSMRGTFNFSGLGGMTSSAFRSRTVDVGLAASEFGFGNIGGATNFTTYASEYAPGVRANLSYTNSNYMLRAAVQYSTGVTKNGWALSFSILGRYAPQDVNPVPGTWYNGLGYALSIQKIFNSKHSLNLTTWGAPTQRASNTWTTQEAYDLAGNNLYNPSWGFQQGKKRSAKVVNSFDPSVLLNWIWKPSSGTKVNTAIGARHNAYSSSAISWYNAADPRPDYYRYLPSYYKPTAEKGTPEYDFQEAQYLGYTDLWKNSEAFRQINWDNFYQTNYLNRQNYERDPALRGMSTYIVERSHSNFASFMLNSYIDTRLNDFMTLQGGLSFNYTDAHYFKTVDDLLGGEFWRDVDTFAERDFPDNADILQNDMNNPERHVKEGDIFGYDFNIRSIIARGWLQNQIVTDHWNVNYGLEYSYTTFRRHGNMRNGRAPENSYGDGVRHTFDNAAFKVGATYKLNGRNYFVGHASYGTHAPTPYNSYVQSRIKDDAVAGLKSDRILAGDLAYVWNYKKFRGSITAYYMHKWNGLETTYYYDYMYNTNMVYTLSGVETEHKGVELGLEYKIINGLSISAAATFARYQYKNNPIGTKSYQNGAAADITQTVYLKNYYLGCTPQQAYSVAVNYNTHGWFFEVNANYFCDNYVYLSPTRHEAMPELYTVCNSEAELQDKIKEIAHQDKLNNAFVLNASIGKMIYTKFGSVNFNLSVNNLTNNTNIQTSGKQEGKFDYTNYDINKFPNKYYYAQGIRVYFNIGVRF